MKATFKTVRTSMLAAPLALIGGMAAAGGLAEPVVTPAPAPAPAPAPVPVGNDWTGFYGGAQLGYGRVEGDPLVEPEGALGGVHAGYMYDLGNVVVGGELDYDATNIEDATTDIALDGVARLKLRAGYDAGQWLPYVTLGAAQAYTSGALDADDTGSFAGVGVAYQMTDNILVGGEVLQHQFEDFDDTDGLDLDATTATARVSFQF